MRKDNFWSPYIAGVGLGLTLLATFYIFGWGLGASSAFSLATAVTVKGISPEYAGSLKYFSRYLGSASPLKNWFIFEIGGLFLGALAGALLSRSFRFRFDKGEYTTNQTRLLTAFGGGMLIG